MSVLVRGRIVRGAEAAAASPILAAGPSEAQRARLSREEAEAHQNADRVVDLALTKSREILDAARAKAENAAREAAREASEEEHARLAAAWIALRVREEERVATDLDRTVTLARLLAERLVGRALELDPGLIGSIAEGVLAEVRDARRLRIEAHPLDADALRVHFEGARLARAGVTPTIVVSTDLARGSLLVHTELGTLDAQLHPRLERLVTALRDALEPA